MPAIQHNTFISHLTKVTDTQNMHNFILHFYQNMSLHQVHNTFIFHLHCAPNYMNAVLINK